MSDNAPQEISGLSHLIGSISDQFKQIEKELESIQHNKREKDKEIEFILNLQKLIARPSLSLMEGIKEILDLIPPLWQYPDETCARIKLKEQEFKTTNFIVETPWRHSAPITVDGEQVGEFEIFYTEDRPDGYQGLLIWEDQRLVEFAAHGISLFLELANIRNRLETIGGDLEIARKATKEYESHFYNYATRIKGIKSKADEAQSALKVGIRNIGNGLYIPLKTIFDLSKELESNESEIQPAKAGRIKNLSADLVRLAGNIIEYINLETGYFKPHRESFSLRSLIDSIVEDLTDQARSKGVEMITFVDALIPDGVIGDKKRLQQILENLVQEALSSTDSGEIIVRVEIEVHAHLLPIFHFGISSSGRVISEDQRTKLFEWFNDDDNDLDSNKLELAYGMAASKKLIELMGGEMWIESPAYLTENSEPASTIHFTLWMDIQKSQESQDFGPMAAESKGLKALIVDDRMANRLMLRSYLENWGWQAMHASGGREALELLELNAHKEEFFNLVLLDMELPDMKGLEVVGKIKDNSWKERFALVLLSYQKDPLNSESAADYGIRAVLKKPLRQKDLYQVITELEREFALPQANKGANHKEDSRQAESSVDSEQQMFSKEPKRILFASRDRLIQLLYKGILEKRGLSVRFVENPADLPGRLKEEPFLALLLDLSGANKRLIDAIQSIRDWNDIVGWHTPIIGILNNDVPETRQRYVEAGVDECVVIRDGYEEIFTGVEQCVKKARSERSGQAEDKPEVMVEFDREKALAAVEGDYNLMYELIEAFEEEIENYIMDLEKAVETADKDDIDRITGTLSGICGKFGVASIADNNRAIAEAAAQDNYDDAKKYILLLKAQVRSLEKQLSQLEKKMVQ